MKTLWLVASYAVGAGLVFLPALGQQKRAAPSSEYPTALVREQQTVIVAGVKETWQLEWKTTPKPVCEPSDVSLTCPCEGFAYGEGGDLDLVRIRRGVERDRLSITAFFQEQFRGGRRTAVVQRWEPDIEKDFEASSKEDFPALVAKRKVVQVMHFADYDHDGRRSEFYFQTEAAPCGKSVGIVIGVSKGNPRLHAFGTASSPNKPLYLQKREWKAVRVASGPIEVVDWQCGDHASDKQTTLRLRWTASGVDGTRREFACTDDDKPGRLNREEPL